METAGKRQKQKRFPVVAGPFLLFADEQFVGYASAPVLDALAPKSKSSDTCTSVT